MPDNRIKSYLSYPSPAVSVSAGCSMNPDTMKALTALFQNGQVVELRVLGPQTSYGYYSNLEKLAADAEILDSRPDIKGVYVTLNTVNPALLSRCMNRVRTADRREPLTADGDIIRRNWLPIDIDPVRPSGISSSDEEHQQAIRKAEQIAGFLSELGWPEPIRADSGNGAHLLYRVDLENSGESSEIVRSCLQTLDQIFSDDTCTIDTAVFNPARIWRLYGSLSRKGDHTTERPHRRSRVISVPEEIETIPFSELLHLASLRQEDDGTGSGQTRGDGKGTRTASHDTIDLSSWLSQHGLSFTEKPYPGGRLYVLDECPFSHAHKDGAYAIQFTNGAIFAGCHHNSCGSGTQRWGELKQRFDDGQNKQPKRDYETYTKEKRRERAEIRKEFAETGKYTGPHKKTEPAEAILADSDPVSPDIIGEARRILHEGDPIGFMLDTFAQEHEGDIPVAKSLILSLASRSVINSSGLHVMVTGRSGKGKSHAFDAMLHHIPPAHRLDGRLSDKALFYAEDLKEGSAICLDDVSLSDHMQELLKGVTTSFQKEFIYRTVDKDRRGVMKVIPKRCLWWVAKVEGSGDDQVWNRMLTAWIDDSEELDAKVLTRELTAAADIPTEPTKISREVLICQQIWLQLSEVFVTIPYAKRIRFASAANRRNPGMLLDMIRSIAAIRQFQREKRTLKGDITCVYATEEDFQTAYELYHALNTHLGGQTTKLTRKQFEFLEQLKASCRTEMTLQELQDMIHESRTTVYRLLHGRAENDTNYTGILDKCPAVSMYRAMITTSNGSRSTNMYTFRASMYDAWMAGASCWLSDDESGQMARDHNDDGGGDDGDDSARSCERDSQMSDTNAPVPSCSGQIPVCSKIPEQGELIEERVESENNDNTKSNNTEILPVPKIREYIDRSDRCDHTSLSICDPGFLEHGAQEHPSEHPVVSDQQDRHAPSDPGSWNTAEQDGAARNTGDSGVSLTTFDPDEFTETDGVKRGPCAVCGHKWVHFIEKGSVKSPDERMKICRRCHSAAVARIIMGISTLPGTVQIQSLERVYCDLGRCKVCNRGRIEWIDRDRGVYICDVCRRREMERGDSSVRL